MVTARLIKSASHPVAPRATRAAPFSVRETGPADAPKPRLLDRVRDAIRAQHYSRRTEKAYVAWIRRYIFFHGKRYPAEMGAPELTRFLTSLAVDGNVAASTQNQALSALLFLYHEVLEQPVPWVDDLVYAKRPHHLPIVLTREEVRAVLAEIHGVPRLMAILLYGGGLRLLECARLRVPDIRRRQHDPNLHPRPEPGPRRGPKPSRWYIRPNSAYFTSDGTDDEMSSSGVPGAANT